MQKNILFFVFTLLTTLSIYSQNNNASYLEFMFGRSIHGSGDTPGYHYGFNYGNDLSNKLYWQLGFEGTLNDTPDFLLTYEDSQGNVYDGSLHTVTAGYQLVLGLRYNFVETNRHKFGISILSVYRYQATSLSDIYSTLYPAATNLPIPVRNIIRFESGRTFAFGGSLRLHYSYEIANSYSLGIVAAFQADINEDTIPHYSLKIGKSF
ncbi:hypothetical protein [Maribacter spongiicola]|uniref:hypothetical protein n=1 Tax=Maribacter spongiicola TaxID=1206753 RepID=UPI003F962179